MKHQYNYNTLVCSCGRTKEQHINIQLVSDKWSYRNLEGKPNVKEMFEEIDKVLEIKR